MRAVIVRFDQKRIEVADHPAPKGAGLRIRPLDVGICGTDREIATFAYGRPPAGAPYLVLGHECLARVVDAPEGSDLRPGELVVPMVRQPCPVPTCRPCRAGRADFCETGQYTEHGIAGAHGFMTGEAIVGAAVAVPEALRPVGVLVEPLTIAEKALLELRAVQRRLPWSAQHADPGDPQDEPGARPRHRAVVLGAGPVGLLGTMALLVRGYETAVWSREPARSDRAERVRSLGAEYLSAADVGPTELGRRFGPVDLVYEATGAATVAIQAVESLGPNGVFVFTGVPGRKAPVELDAGRMLRRLVLTNQLVFGTVNAGRHAYEAAVRDLSVFSVRWPDTVRGLIAARHPLDAVPALLRERVPGVKQVVAVSD